MSKIFVIGDIHGAHKALVQCLERSNFNNETDTLIQLGDVADGWSEVYECVDELLKVKNLISIRGNHDKWVDEWIKFGMHPTRWQQGGLGTLKSYCDNLDKEYGIDDNTYITDLNPENIPISHIEFFRKQLNYYKDKDNNLFVHGGFNRHFLLKDQYEESIFYWDRDLWMQALSTKGTDIKLKIKEPLNEIFIGHTTTKTWKTDQPMYACNIWNLDTGCGFGNGKLTIMDIESKEFWQSDPANSLYPNEFGR